MQFSYQTPIWEFCQKGISTTETRRKMEKRVIVRGETCKMGVVDEDERAEGG